MNERLQARPWERGFDVSNMVIVVKTLCRTVVRARVSRVAAVSYLPRIAHKPIIVTHDYQATHCVRQVRGAPRLLKTPSAERCMPMPTQDTGRKLKTETPPRGQPAPRRSYPSFHVVGGGAHCTHACRLHNSVSCALAVGSWVITARDCHAAVKSRHHALSVRSTL